MSRNQADPIPGETGPIASRAQELLAEAESLCRTLAALHGERRDLAGVGAQEQHHLDNLERLQSTLCAAEHELERQRTVVEELGGEITRYRQQHLRLREQMQAAEDERAQFWERFVALEERISHLVGLYAASYRLHETLDQGEVLGILQEIVANILGSEELAVFDLDPARAELRLLHAFGVGPERCQALRVPQGELSEALRRGEPFVPAAQAAAEGDGLTAFVPLRLVGRVVGAIAIFRLLPQKKAVQPSDMELLELLATHAAMALHCCRLHGEARAAEGARG